MSKITVPDKCFALMPENQHESIAVARALCNFAETASDELMLICVAIVELNGDVNKCEDLLGFSKGRCGSRIQSPLARQIIRRLSVAKATGEGYALAVGTLMEVAANKSSAAGSRIRAASLLMELSEGEEAKTSGKAGGEKNFNEMTLHELEQYVQSIRHDMQVIDHDNTLEHSTRP